MENLFLSFNLLQNCCELKQSEKKKRYSLTICSKHLVFIKFRNTFVAVIIYY